MGHDPHPFYVPPSGIDQDGNLSFPDEEARHILRVIRMRPGEQCRVVDGVGGSYLVRLIEAGEALRGTILESKRSAPADPVLELGFPMLRMRARTEWLLEKAVEVGVDRLVPVLWSRSVKRKFDAVRDRWERILREAMKQSERCWLPSLGEPVDAGDAPGGIRLILADPDGEEALPDLPGTGTVRLLIGPEGGLRPEERERLRTEGAALWSLGPTRLRAETAGVVGSHRLRSALRDAVARRE
jgi:16S rRNA (uracil1498-N3)-methyltransferase